MYRSMSFLDRHLGAGCRPGHTGVRGRGLQAGASTSPDEFIIGSRFKSKPLGKSHVRRSQY